MNTNIHITTDTETAQQLLSSKLTMAGVALFPVSEAHTQANAQYCAHRQADC